MPWFRKQSDKAKKRLQRQQYLAREDPGPLFDINSCEVSDIPQGVYSLCKVLNKEVLLAHTNWLTSLKGGGSFIDLANLTVLDLHDNELVTLPPDIGYLTSLEVLNLSSNKLKELPDSIGHLESLHTLQVPGNKLKALPSTICDLENLCTLDISSNFIHTLPEQLCQLRLLQNLRLDAAHMTFPTPDICQSETEVIMKYLCKEHGIKYVSPSEMKRVDSRKSTSSRSEQLQSEVEAVTNTLRLYEEQKQKKRLEMLAVEQQFEEEQKLQAFAAATATANKQHLISSMAQDQARMDGELSAIQHQHDSERTKLVTALQKVEHSTGLLVKQLLEISERSRRTEQLMDKMENERMEMEKWWEVRQEESETLRKKDVLVNMEKVLLENAQMTQVIQGSLADRDLLARRTHNRAISEEGRLNSLLLAKQADKNVMVEELLKEEELQKGAFEALQMQKDAKHKRIRGQIEVIEQELSQLTQLEVEQRDLKLNIQMNVIAEKRQTLMEMLVQLMDERDKRETELHHRLNEMEVQKENTQTDYWLVQYQRLMDRKPSAMVNLEKQLEFSVLEILEDSAATDYTSLFARHRISIETLLQIKDEDLKQMGVHELGLRKNLLRSISKYKFKKEEERAAAKVKGLENNEDEWLVKPPEPDVRPRAREAAGAPAGDVTPGAQAQTHEVTAHFSTECVVCMEFTSSVLFLQCGHICCCSNCAHTLADCPLCRAVIAQKIVLKQTKKILGRATSTEERS